MSKDPSKLQRQLARQIARYINTNRLTPGTPMTEVALADIFKVSRTPIRSALSLLARQGVVAPSERRGFVVGEPAAAVKAEEEDDEEALYLRIAADHVGGEIAEHFSETDLLRRYGIGRSLLNRVLQSMTRDFVIERGQGHGWRFAPVFKSAEADAESYRFRRVIEPASVREPGYVLDKERAERSRRGHEEILATPRNRLSQLRFFNVNAEFHELVVAGSGNGFFVQAIQQQNRLRRLLNLQWPYGDQRIVDSCVEHMSVLSALEEGDNEWAAALMRHHLDLAMR